MVRASYMRNAAPHSTHGVMFHHFHGGEHIARQGSLTRTDLAALLDYVAASAEILPASIWLEGAVAGTLRPDQVCLTFDDGLRCQLDLAVPELERRGLTAFFFVYTSIFEGELPWLELYADFRHRAFSDFDAFFRAFVDALDLLDDAPAIRRQLEAFDPATYLRECGFYSNNDRRFRYLRDQLLGADRYHRVMRSMLDSGGLQGRAHALMMDAEDIARLSAAGHVIGLHSHSHPTRIDVLDRASQRAEYMRNRSILETILGGLPSTVAHPCGAYDQTTLDVLRRLDVDIGFRADMGHGSGTSLEIPRQDHANIMAMLSGRFVV